MHKLLLGYYWDLIFKFIQTSENFAQTAIKLGKNSYSHKRNRWSKCYIKISV